MLSQPGTTLQGLQVSRLVLPSRPCPTWFVVVAVHHTNSANYCWAVMYNQAGVTPCVMSLQGYLTIADLYTFFRDIHALWVNMGEYAELEIYDVLDEIMDMVKPATPGRITKADLEACKMSGTVFSMLSNVDQFYQYNFRENFMHQDGDDTSS